MKFEEWRASPEYKQNYAAYDEALNMRWRTKQKLMSPRFCDLFLDPHREIAICTFEEWSYGLRPDTFTINPGWLLRRWFKIKIPERGPEAFLMFASIGKDDDHKWFDDHLLPGPNGEPTHALCRMNGHFLTGDHDFTAVARLGEGKRVRERVYKAVLPHISEHLRLFPATTQSYNNNFWR